MTAIATDLYDALRSAGVDEELARKASRVGAGDDRSERFTRETEKLDARLTRFEARLQQLSVMTMALLVVSGGIFTGTMIIVLGAMQTTSG